MGVYNTATNTWEHDTAYTYDSMSRLATLASLGKSATYTRINSSNRLSNVAFANNVGAPNIGYTYDYQLRLAGKGGISRGFNSKDEVQYTSGDNNYGYDDKGQLARWGIGVINEGVLIGTSTEYDYDEIGNVLSGSLTYNNVNQPSNLTFDADGNMLQNGAKLYTYDAENRLKTVGSARSFLRFYYDYAGRCFKRTSVSVSNGTETETVREYLIYNGTKIIAVVNRFGTGINEKYTWQPESSGDADVLLWDASGVYVTDCNKNVVARYYFNPDVWQNLVDTFSYTAFGVPTTTGTGNFPRFLFSSEEYDVSENLYFYLYRAYNPALKRWLTRDLIEENGGVNLYNFVGNNPLSRWDRRGLESSCCGEAIDDRLNELLRNIELYSNSEQYKHYFTGNGMLNPLDGWDIKELFDAGQPFNTETRSKKCENTVTLGGMCFKVWAVNYILWGRIMALKNRLIGGTLHEYSDVSNPIYLYRALFPIDHTENESFEQGTYSRAFFASLGYNNASISSETISQHIYKHVDDKSISASVGLGVTAYKNDTNITADMIAYDCSPSSVQRRKKLSAYIRNTDDDFLYIDSAGNGTPNSKSYISR